MLSETYGGSPIRNWKRTMYSEVSRGAVDVLVKVKALREGSNACVTVR